MNHATTWNTFLDPRFDDLRCLAAKQNGKIVNPVHQPAAGGPIADPRKFDSRLQNFPSLVKLLSNAGCSPAISLEENNLGAFRFRNTLSGQAIKTTLFSKLGPLRTQSHVDSNGTTFVVRLCDLVPLNFSAGDFEFASVGFVDYALEFGENVIHQIPESWLALVSAADVRQELNRVLIASLKELDEFVSDAARVPDHAVRARRDFRVMVNGQLLDIPSGALIVEPQIVAQLPADGIMPASEPFTPNGPPPGRLVFEEQCFLRVSPNEFIDKPKGGFIDDPDEATLLALTRAGARFVYSPRHRHGEEKPRRGRAVPA